MKFNDLNIENWKESHINVDSLWLIQARDKSGKHSNKYHGNFVPQVANQLISRFTKKNELVLDLFLGSGTSLFECENLSRNFIGFDINDEILNFVENKMKNTKNIKFSIQNCDVTNNFEFDIKIAQAFDKLSISSIQFLIMHPPYMDIVQFTDKKEDLSHIDNISDFIKAFLKAVNNGLKFLDKNRYFAVIIGDVYKNSEVMPLAFYAIDSIKKNFQVKLKGIVVKNIEGNRGKLATGGIWRYRALKSDYYIFKHEYILIFKKEF